MKKNCRRPQTTTVWVRARKIGNKKKRKKEEDNQWVPRKSRKKRKKRSFRRKEAVVCVHTMGPTNFDTFTIGRKKKKLIWYRCKKKFPLSTFNL